MKYLRFKLNQIKEIATDPRYIPFLIQRRFKNPETRQRVSGWLAKRRPAKSFSDQLNRKSAELLAENGIAHLGKILTDEQIADAKQHLENSLIRDPYLPQVPAFRPMDKDRPASVHVAFHESEDVISTPHMLQLANRPAMLAIAEQFLGCKPTIGYMASWWSFATKEAALAAERFHRDVDDWRFLKLFIYLTDVNEQQGPHIYVQASADSERLLDIRRFDDEEVVSAFGDNAILVNTGKAGEAFFENTYGLHKGQPVKAGHRLLFQVVYTLTPLPYGPRRPVGALSKARLATGQDLDPFINRIYLDPNQ